jgi:hypothetical protein
MISAVPDYLPTSLSTPPGIISYFHGSLPGGDMAEKEIIPNIYNYAGFENTMYSFNVCKHDAICRYGKVYNVNNYNIELIKPFLDAVKIIVQNSRLIPRFNFYPDGAKAVFTFNEQKITVEYDTDEPESVFVSKYINNVLHIKDTTINNLSRALGAFL